VAGQGVRPPVPATAAPAYPERTRASVNRRSRAAQWPGSTRCAPNRSRPPAGSCAAGRRAGAPASARPARSRPRGPHVFGLIKHVCEVHFPYLLTTRYEGAVPAVFPPGRQRCALAEARAHSDHSISAMLCHFGLLDEEAVLPSIVSSREYRCRMKAEHDRGLGGIDDFIAAYEAEHGEIAEEEMEAAYRRAKARAIVIRGGRVVDDKGTGVE
jgi:hypothetical protein